MNYSKIVGANIKRLRLRFEETQQALATDYNEYCGKSIKFNTISQYESGKRTPPLDFLAFVANRYYSTIDALLIPSDNTDENIISDTQKTEIQVSIKTEDILKLITSMFPIYYSDEAFDDPIFKETYYIHKKFYLQIESQKNTSFGIISNCYDQYKNSYEENETLASVANMVSIVLFIFSIYQSDNFNDTLSSNQLLKFNQISKMKYLVNLPRENDSELNQAKKDFIKEYLKDTMVNIARLRMSNKFRDIGDYFFLLSFYLGFSYSENISISSQKTILEIMEFMGIFGNKYCMNFHDNLMSLFNFTNREAESEEKPC